MNYEVMVNKALEIINAEEDFSLEKYFCCNEDATVNILLLHRINYLRHNYQLYKRDHPIATYETDERLERIVDRLAKILPSFVYLEAEEG